MKRLIERGLMFGNLIHVDSPALIERYNRALKHLTGKETKLSVISISMSVAIHPKSVTNWAIICTSTMRGSTASSSF